MALAATLHEQRETLAVTVQSFCEPAVAVDDDVYGRFQILARMIRCKLAEVGRTDGCLVLRRDNRRILAMVPDMVAVAAGQSKTQKEEGKGEADSVHDLAEGVVMVVAHGLEDNDTVEDTGEVAAKAQYKNWAVEDIREAADNAHHSLLEVVEGRI